MMARIIVQNDDGQTIDTFEYPNTLEYAIVAYMPSCPQNAKVNDLLNWLKRTVRRANANFERSP